MKTHYVIYGGGNQVLYTLPYTHEGEPMLLSSAQVRVVDLRVHEDSADRDVVALTSATLDTTTDTTTTAIGRGATSKVRVEVSTPGNFIAGASYALVSPTGEIQEVEVDHTDDDAVYVRKAVRGAYPVGSTLRGFALRVTFPSTEADSETAFDQHAECPYAVDWYFTGHPVARSRELIWMRRAPEAIVARPHDVEVLDATIGRLNTQEKKVENALIQAHRDFWRRIRAKGIDTDTVHFSDSARDWVAYRAAEVLRRGMGDERSDELADGYKRAHDGIIHDLGGFGDTFTDKKTDKAGLDVNERLQAGFQIL